MPVWWFQQVEDYLASVRIYSEEVSRREDAMKSAQEFLGLEMVRYQTGVDPYVDVLTAQTTLLSDQENLATAQINEIVGSVNLIEALGGGWDRSQLPGASEVSRQTSNGYKKQE